jgi:hypothetical protein
MSNVTDIVLNNGESTPVAKTFTPDVVDANLVSYSEKSGVSYLAHPTLSLGRRMPTAQNGNRKATIRVKVPVLEEISGTTTGYTPGPKVAYTLLANIDVVIPSRASAAERADLAAFAANGLAHSVINALIEDGDFPY